MNGQARYDQLELLSIAGRWREGGAGRRLKVTNPFSGDALLEIAMASHDDLDEAYRAAQDAQPDWEAKGPGARAAVMHKAVAVLDARKDEIIDWLVREAGSTRLKAEIEWGSARAITLEAAGMPGRSHGHVLASDVPGRQSLVHRRALGVVGGLAFAAGLQALGSLALHGGRDGHRGLGRICGPRARDRSSMGSRRELRAPARRALAHRLRRAELRCARASRR